MSQAHDTDRLKMDDRDYSVTCKGCGATFEATRSDASFCSARCRVRWSRRPAQRLKAIEELEAMRLRLHEMEKSYSCDAGFTQGLESLRGAAKYFIERIEGEWPDNQNP
jgi:endogenous inhibitor of DNA gyrase (YacG/DUF329 family)